MSDIILNQISTACLSHFSYYLESNKEALIIDPINENEAYLESLNNNSATLKYVLSTGTKADYICGCIQLALKTNSTLIFSKNHSFRYNNILISYEELMKCDSEKVAIENENENENENVIENSDNQNINNENKIESNEQKQTLNLKDYLNLFNLKIEFLEDNKSIQLGKINVVMIETPGYSLDSCCYLVVDGFKKQNCLFSGNTIMPGDIGRPNEFILNYRRDRIFKADLAEMLYHSVKKLKELISENLIIYSTSTFGSFVGKTILNSKSTNLKEEKMNNKYIAEMSLENFIKMIGNDDYNYPKYFSGIIKQNLEKFSKNKFETNLEESHKPIKVDFLFDLIKRKENFVILDTRFPFSELTEFIPGSILISLKSLFTIWSGALIDNLQSIVLICKEGNELNAVKRLLRLGLFNIIGYLEGGYESYSNSYIDFCKSNDLCIDDYNPIKFKFISENKAIDYIFNQEYKILDVRERIEQKNNPIANSINVPLTSINEEFSIIPKDIPLYIGCKTGIRSAIAFSILSNKGYKNINVLEGGFSKISEKGVRI